METRIFQIIFFLFVMVAMSKEFGCKIGKADNQCKGCVKPELRKDDATCDKCSDNADLVGGKCIPKNTVCDNSCATCNGPTFSDCLSCDFQFRFVDDDKDGVGRCDSCHFSCNSCKGPGRTDCKTCYWGFELKDDDGDYVGECMPVPVPEPQPAPEKSEPKAKPEPQKDSKMMFYTILDAGLHCKNKLAIQSEEECFAIATKMLDDNLKIEKSTEVDVSTSTRSEYITTTISRSTTTVTSTVTESSSSNRLLDQDLKSYFDQKVDVGDKDELIQILQKRGGKGAAIKNNEKFFAVMSKKYEDAYIRQFVENFYEGNESLPSGCSVRRTESVDQKDEKENSENGISVKKNTIKDISYEIIFNKASTGYTRASKDHTAICKK